MNVLSLRDFLRTRAGIRDESVAELMPRLTSHRCYSLPDLKRIRDQGGLAGIFDAPETVRMVTDRLDALYAPPVLATAANPRPPVQANIFQPVPSASAVTYLPAGPPVVFVVPPSGSAPPMPPPFVFMNSGAVPPASVPPAVMAPPPAVAPPPAAAAAAAAAARARRRRASARGGLAG